MDLSLIPIDDLVDEIERRSTAYGVVMLTIDEGNKEIVRTFWSEESFVTTMGVVSALETVVRTAYNGNSK